MNKKIFTTSIILASVFFAMNAAEARISVTIGDDGYYRYESRLPPPPPPPRYREYVVVTPPPPPHPRFRGYYVAPPPPPGHHFAPPPPRRGFDMGPRGGFGPHHPPRGGRPGDMGPMHHLNAR